MADLSTSAAVVAGAGFATQRLIEIFDPLFARLPPLAKKTVTALSASLVGVVFTWLGQFTMLYATYPQYRDDVGKWLTNLLVTGLAIGAGTEGVNSVLKYAQYAKDGKKSDAGAYMPQPPPTVAAAKARV